jgi:hypothetical protein
MIRELDRVHRPHLHANPLKRKDRSAVAYVPIRNTGLD